MFTSPMFIILFILNRCIIEGPLSFKVQVVSTQYFDSVRLLAGAPNNFRSGIGCFDVSETDVLVIFFPTHSFYNRRCPPLVGAIRTSAHGVRASDVFELNVLLPFFFFTYIETILLKVDTT